MKTDNKHLESKLLLRRHFLKQIEDAGTPIDVLDCFQGDGVIWSKLRTEFSVNSYFGLDMKRKPGRLKMDSARFLSLPGWKQNIVDLDAYGSPWGHWLNLLLTCRHNVTVFVTQGRNTAAYGGAGVCNAAMQMIGLKLNLPAKALSSHLHSAIAFYALAKAEDRGFTVDSVYEAFPQTNARYLGFNMTYNKRS